MPRLQFPIVQTLAKKEGDKVDEYRIGDLRDYGQHNFG